METLLQRVADYWASQEIMPGQGMSEVEILAFEHRYGVLVPPDFHLYLRTVNGMAGGDSDGDFIAFHDLTTYHLSFFTPPNHWQRVDKVEGKTRPSGAQICFEVADWMIDSAVVGVFLTEQPQPTTPVYSLFNRDPQPRQIAASVAEFFQRYLDYDEHQIVDYFNGDSPCQAAGD